MIAVTNLLKLPLLRSVYRAFAVGLVFYFCADILFVASHFNLMADPEAPTEYANGVALGVGALICLMIGHHHKLWSAARIFWTLSAFAVLLLAANEMFDLPVRIDRAWSDDGYFDLFILAVTPIGLYLACSFENAPRLPALAMVVGFVCQCLSDILDLVDDGFDRYWDRRVTDMINDLSQLIFIETYLFGLVCLLLILLARRFLPQSGQTSRLREP